MPDYSNWPVTDGTLRSAVIQPDGMGDDLLSVAGRVFPPLVVLLALRALVRGHRATFMYTYSVEGKFHAGSTARFVKSTLGPPPLYGRKPGDAIRVRYNLEHPEQSVLLAEDNK